MAKKRVIGKHSCPYGLLHTVTRREDSTDFLMEIHPGVMHRHDGLLGDFDGRSGTVGQRTAADCRNRFQRGAASKYHPAGITIAVAIKVPFFVDDTLCSGNNSPGSGVHCLDG
jgi:hypothetical protein